MNTRLLFLTILSLSVLTFLSCSSVNTQKISYYDSLDNLFAERIVVSDQSSQISNIDVNLRFPENYKMLPEAEPFVKIFTKKEIIAEYPFKVSENIYPLNIEIKDKELYIHLGLFYCREGAQGLCLMKNIIFTVELNPSKSREMLILNYEVLDEEY